MRVPQPLDADVVRITSTRLRGFLATRAGRIFLAILVVAVGIRLPLMTFRGYYSDLATYIGWGNTVVQHFFDIYTSTAATGVGGFPRGPGGGGFPGGGLPGGGFRGGGFGGAGGGGTGGGGSINYPPGMPYLFGAVVFAYNQFVLPLTHTSLDALMRQDGFGPFFAKIPLLIADLAAVVLLYVWARRRRSERFALVVAAAYAFSPAVLYDGALWGQTDALVALPILLAIVALTSERYALAGVSLAVALLLKPQPIIFAPLIALYVWRWARREQFARFAVAGLLTGLLLLLPVILPHFQLVDMVRNMQSASYNDNLSLSSDAFNFWWLIGYGQQAIGSTFLGVKSGLVGDALFGAVTLLCGIQVWRRREPIILVFGLAVQLFGFFQFMGGQHERYLFLFIPLALASLVLARREERPHLAALYALGTALCFLNMVVGVGGGLFGGGEPIPFLASPSLRAWLSANFVWLSTAIAAAHVAVFAYAVYVYLAILGRGSVSSQFVAGVGSIPTGEPALSSGG